MVLYEKEAQGKISKSYESKRTRTKQEGQQGRTILRKKKRAYGEEPFFWGMGFMGKVGNRSSGKYWVEGLRESYPAKGGPIVCRFNGELGACVDSVLGWKKGTKEAGKDAQLEIIPRGNERRQQPNF